MGYGKTGADADAQDNSNYNWTIPDALIRYITSHGAVASINTGAGSNTTEDTITNVAYMITDRYMNGAYGSGFYNALELFDFGAESDLVDYGFGGDYQASLSAFTAFAKGVARANSSAGVGAWGGNRIYPITENYSLYDPYVQRFYKDCKDQNVPIKAATFHFSNAAYSFDRE